MISLSSSQAQIVEAPLGCAIRVLASAGSGKTRVLTERVRHIMEHTKKDGIIAITFTNKAAEEMQTRLEGIDGFEERCWITTVHSLCQRIIDQYGHAIGLPSDLHIYERDQDRKSVFLQSLRDSGTDVDAFLDVSDTETKRDRERVIQNYLDQFSVVKRNLLSIQEIEEKYSEHGSFLQIYAAYQDALLQSGGMDFDDILVFAVRILLEQPWCAQIYRAKYKHLCVDEAQDLNRAQYEFVKAFCGTEIRSVLMVGDPNQMIYGFNGSSHEYLCENFVEDFNPQSFTLSENYRSSKAVVRLANKLKPGSQIEADFAKTGLAEILAFQDEEAEAAWVCGKILDLLQPGADCGGEIEGEIGLSKIVILGRNRFAFQSIEKELDDKKIGYSLKKGERHAEPMSIFGKVLDLGIRLRLNPKDWVDGKKLFSTLKVQFPSRWGDDLQLENLAALVSDAAIAYPELQAEVLRAIHHLDIEEPNILKFCTGFAKRIEELSLNMESESSGELERSLLELQEFRGLWTGFKRKGLGNTLSAFRNAIALGQLFDDASQQGLTLSTVHTMKGLEKDIVFLVGMCEGVFPDYRAQTPKELEEELNNAFVAVTRSRRWIYISYPQRRMMPWGDTKFQRPSRFLKLMED
ncbi:MAG: ATP-dependent helicase [Verrucomicrobia bacterium]|nr:ATP-dependent helicase [Verrucomicrobiota bacterium]